MKDILAVKEKGTTGRKIKKNCERKAAVCADMRKFVFSFTIKLFPVYSK